MLNIQYIPYQKIESLNAVERVNLLMSMLKNGKILIIDARLDSNDEALLIREAMSNITGKFNGIEIGVMHTHEEKKALSGIRHKLANMLIGDRRGITLIGPANVICELRQYPESIELYLNKNCLDDAKAKDKSTNKRTK
ncbi:MAG: OapB/ArvB family protein [Candidatus Woesearchaeota archaeon]